MTRYCVAPAVLASIDDINDYTAERWGEAQATDYTLALFRELDRIAGRDVPWQALPATYRIKGFRRSWEKHFIYWRVEHDDSVTFVAILHQAMDQRRRLAPMFE